MRIRYALHPCPQCQKMTSRKHYCDPCLKVIKRPQYVFEKPTLRILAECEFGNGHRRESINELR